MQGSNIKIGTRGSQLALWQANWIKTELNKNFPSLSIEIVVIKTKGDKILDVPLAKVGGKGLFVKEIEEALLDRRIDIAVHSMKDMPADLPEGLCIGPVPQREIPADVLISQNGLLLSELKPQARIGTSSLRRAAQIRHAKPNCTILPLRGNLDTRLKKLETTDLDAIVLAAAGVKRLNLATRITQYLDYEIVLPAVGQGALCIEIRKHDVEIEKLVSKLNHPKTRAEVMGERAFLRTLGGSCQVPVAAYGKISQNSFTLLGLVADVEGKNIIKQSIAGPKGTSENLGIKLAQRLLLMGADTILEKLKANEP
ncbi:MAG: hydroxymethylbilane synthase [Thermodesulfobacteriota bacterium]|nr:hydroxymethylbilane synthase [Thermodesulfobacteriota bacterium]